MESQTLMVVGVTAVVCFLIAIGAWLVYNRVRSRRLQERFGPEYDHVMERARDRNLAEAELEQREKRVKNYRIVPLSEKDRHYYESAWTEVQSRFVDDPQGATKDADRLIFEVMEKRGYPVEGFDQAAADLSVDYPSIVEHYRAARLIAERNRRGEANTEELRQALVHYRTLFSELLHKEVREVPQETARPGVAEGFQSGFAGFGKKIRRGGVRP